MSGERTNSGRRLNQEWGVGALHALYHKDGNWYEQLTSFPGALFDPNGYVLFRTRDDYEASRYIDHGIKIHVSGGISRMPGYVRIRAGSSAVPTFVPAATRPSVPRPGSVSVGSTVSLWDGSVYVVGQDVSPESPVGQALMGRVAGETVTAQGPRGPITLRILSVE